MQDLQMLRDAARRRRRDLLVARTRHHRARLLKHYPRRPCAPSFVKSRMLRPLLQTHLLLFQQIFFVFVCIHPGTPRVPPRVLASGPKPRGGKNQPLNLDSGKHLLNFYSPRLPWLDFFSSFCCAGISFRDSPTPSKKYWSVPK